MCVYPEDHRRKQTHGSAGYTVQLPTQDDLIDQRCCRRIKKTEANKNLWK